MDDTRTILASNDHERPSPAHQIVLAIDEMTAAIASERLKAKFSTKIHRFPRSLQGIGGDNDRYIVPSMVAIGPYHHGSPHLQMMEEVKLVTAYHHCKHSGRSSMVVYEKILSIVGDARGCYDAVDPSVAGLSDADLATMMFLDGCFLLQYMVAGGDEPVLLNIFSTAGPGIQRDIFLLENQTPWLVLEVLRELTIMPIDVRRYVAGIQEKFINPAGIKLKKVVRHGFSDDYTPVHLLDLLWYTQVGSMTADVKNYSGYEPPLMSINAAQLAENGIRLTPSTKPLFSGISFQRRHLFGELSLSPVLLHDITACWLVNLAALEEASSSAGSGASGDSYVVSSYLFMLAMLMDREEEVEQMRSNNIIHSTWSNKQALRFFKDHGEHLRVSDPCFITLKAFSLYRHHVCIITYRFIYKNYKTIGAVLSVAGVLFSILNALYSLKKSYRPN